jgi:outer membrane protein
MLNAFLKTVAALVLGAIACTGAAAADLKIGFLSTERVLRESAPAVRAQKKLEREFEKREADLKKMDRQIRDLQATLDRDAATMAESDRNNKVRELVDGFQRSERSFAGRQHAQEQREPQERADKIIKQIADVEKFDLILQGVWGPPAD